ncbi:MAG: elongation factor P [Bacteroidota bacterium]
MANTSDFRKGLCLEMDGQVYIITDFQHVKPGKGPAFVRTTLKNIATQRTHEKTFTSGVKIKTARVERRMSQFLYKDSQGYHFMDSESNEMLVLPKSLIPTPELLKEGQENVELVVHQETEEVLDCNLPLVVSLQVTYTEPGLRGDTVNKAMKPATLETGYELKVPLFINTDDMIRVDTRKGTYLERERT